MSKLIEKLRSEDWTTVWVSIPLLALALLAASFMPKVPNSLITAKAWGNIGLLFIITFVVLVAGLSIMGKQYKFKSLILSFVVVFAISILALVVSGVKEVKYYGFEAVFFSVVFGLIVRNFLKVPEWMKPAIQGEFFIKVGVVCLGATILIQEVMKSGIFGLIQAILVVSVVWFTAFFIAKALKVDERSAMILSSGVSICGVSACITAARVANGDDKKLSYIVSIVLIIVVPMIYLMPWLAKLILPQIFSDPTTIQEVSGAWIGGTIDTTSGVAASSTIAGEIANQQAVIIKAAQNVLIGVVAFFIALYLSTRRTAEGNGSKSSRPSFGIVWEKFPKFIIGFFVASLVASFLIQPVFGADQVSAINKVLDQYKNWAFVLAFTSIGLDTNFKEIWKSMQGGKVLWLYVVGQVFNILLTLFAVWLLLSGVLFPIPVLS